MITVTSKGAGGTAKTTTAWALAHGLARRGERVVLINMDGQTSLEERCLAKLVNASFNSDVDSFYASNGLADQTVLAGLQALKDFQPLSTGAAPRPVPRPVVGIDVTKLGTERHEGPGGPGKVFLVRSDDNISAWESQLSNAILFYKIGQTAGNDRVYGALYHLAQMQSYMLDAHWVIVDTGPGSGPLFMNAVMSAHGFIVPSCIDQKANSLIRSLTTKIDEWSNANDQDSHVSIRNVINQVRVARDGEAIPNRYPMPDHTPKFLGMVYSRLGLRGRQFPYNQYAAMAESNNSLSNILMPTLDRHGMLLYASVPTPAGNVNVYDNARNQLPQAFDDFNAPQANAHIRVPVAPRGVLGIWVEFGQLQQMSERDSIPVFYIPTEPWSMRRPKPPKLQQFIAAVEQGLDPPFSIYAPDVYEPCSVQDRERMGAKVDHLQSILNNVLAVLDVDFNALPPIAAVVVPVVVPAVQDMQIN